MYPTLNQSPTLCPSATAETLGCDTHAGYGEHLGGSNMEAVKNGSGGLVKSAWQLQPDSLVVEIVGETMLP